MCHLSSGSASHSSACPLPWRTILWISLASQMERPSAWDCTCNYRWMGESGNSSFFASGQNDPEPWFTEWMWSACGSGRSNLGALLWPRMHWVPSSLLPTRTHDFPSFPWESPYTCVHTDLRVSLKTPLLWHVHYTPTDTGRKVSLTWFGAVGKGFPKKVIFPVIKDKQGSAKMDKWEKEHILTQGYVYWF